MVENKALNFCHYAKIHTNPKYLRLVISQTFWLFLWRWSWIRLTYKLVDSMKNVLPNLQWASANRRPDCNKKAGLPLSNELFPPASFQSGLFPCLQTWIEISILHWLWPAGLQIGTSDFLGHQFANLQYRYWGTKLSP